jgi:polyisoprenoid-binding protein YceI
MEEYMTSTIPGYIAGTWNADTTHSEVGFSVRHMMVSKVRGKFTTWEATIVTGETPQSSSLTASIQLDSIDTGNADRDGHIKSADIFNVAEHNVMTYTSTGITQKGDDWLVDGNLTLHGVTKPVQLKVEFNGITGDPYGGTRSGFSATTEISRGDFGIEFNMPMDGGGVVIGDKVNIALEIEAVLAS